MSAATRLIERMMKLKMDEIDLSWGGVKKAASNAFGGGSTASATTTPPSSSDGNKYKSGPLTTYTYNQSSGSYTPNVPANEPKETPKQGGIGGAVDTMKDRLQQNRDAKNY